MADGPTSAFACSLIGGLITLGASLLLINDWLFMYSNSGLTFTYSLWYIIGFVDFTAVEAPGSSRHGSRLRGSDNLRGSAATFRAKAEGGERLSYRDNCHNRRRACDLLWDVDWRNPVGHRRLPGAHLETAGRGDTPKSELRVEFQTSIRSV